jgi:hypothetical protein
VTAHKRCNAWQQDWSDGTQTAQFFTSVLTELKFQKEVAEIEKILESEDLSNQQKISALSVLRGSTEMNVQNFQKERN